MDDHLSVRPDLGYPSLAPVQEVDGSAHDGRLLGVRRAEPVLAVPKLTDLRLEISHESDAI